MKRRLIAIGNSRGIVIPKFICEECELEEEVELHINKGVITIQPVRKGREGWAEAFKNG